MTRPTLLDAQGNPALAGRITPRESPGRGTPYAHDPADPTERSFARYCAWRRTKCQPRDRNDPDQRFHEVNQSLHEFVGEVAELGELLQGDHIYSFYVGSTCDKLIDEIGDIFFCGCWLLDAFGANPFLDKDAPTPGTLIEPERMAEAAAVSRRLDEVEVDDRPLGAEEQAEINGLVAGLGWQMAIRSGKLSNTFKKAAYQLREQPTWPQVVDVVTVLSIAAYLLIMAGATVEDALRANITKLDARYPLGYQGPGGGDRTGKGAGK